MKKKSIQQLFDEIKETLFPKLGKGWNLVICDDIIGNYVPEEERYLYSYTGYVQPWGCCVTKKKEIVILAENSYYLPTENAIKGTIIHEFCHIGHSGHGNDFYQQMALKRRQLIKLGGQTNLCSDLRKEIKAHYRKDSKKKNIYERKVLSYAAQINAAYDEDCWSIKNVMKDIPRNYYKSVWKLVSDERCPTKIDQ